MSNLDSINDIDFDQKVLQANNPVLVDFWASWCRPCLMVAPMLDELAGKYDGRINFVKVDVAVVGVILLRWILLRWGLFC